MTSTYRRFFSESSLLVLAHAIRLGFRVGTAILIARTLGPSGYGDFAYALSVIFILSVSSGMGMSRPLTRRAVEGRPEDGVLYTTALILGSSVAALAALAIWVFEEAARGGPGLLTLMAPMLVLNTTELLLSWYLGRQVYGPIALLQAAGSLLAGAVVVVLFLLEATARQFALAMVLNSALSAAVLLWFRPREHRAQGAAALRTLLPNGRRLLAEGWPFLAADLVMLAMARLDHVLVRDLAGSEQLGFYAVAARLTETSAFFPNLVASAFVPVLAELRSRGREAADEALRQVYVGVLLLGLLWTGVLVAFRAEIVSVLFGDDFLPGADVIAIHAWACAPVFLIAIRAQWVVLHGHQRRMLLAGFGAACVQVGLLWLLVPHYGARGAAVAHVTGVCAHLYLTPLLVGPALASHTRMLLGAFNPLRWPAAIRTLARGLRGSAGL